MEFKGKHVLVLEGYCKQCLPFLRGFKQAGCEVSVLCSSRLDCSYVSRFPDHRILGVCDPHKPSESEAYIVSLIKQGHYDLVFPPFDFSARILSRHKEELSAYALLYANDEVVFRKANDKEEVMKTCQEHDIPCPRTYFSMENLAFPLVLKPRDQYGARGFHVCRSREELIRYIEEKHIERDQYVMQEYIPEGSCVAGSVQMIDREGVIKSSYLYRCEHVFPENGGTSTLNALLKRDDIRSECDRLVRLMGLRGIVGVDLMIDGRTGEGKVIEINPRPVHGIALGFFAGMDHARQVLEDAFGEEVTAMEPKRWDISSRILQTDVLWFLTSRNRFRLSPRKLGYKVKEQMFFWDDPLPWLAFLLEGLRDFQRKMKEKKQ